jgi:hypothetical protein
MKYKQEDGNPGQPQGINMRPYLKTTYRKKAGDRVQVVEPLPGRLETLSSKPSITKRKKEGRRN